MATMQLQTGPRAMLTEALAAATQSFVAKNPRSRELFEEAAQSMPGGNTRSSLFVEPFPVCMVRGSGSQIVDADGHHYADFLGEFTAGIYGHSPEGVQQALRDALDEGMNLSSHTPWEARLARLICTRFPSMQLVRFTNSGTEANLMALAAARAATGRHRVMVFEGGYHGSILNFPAGGSATTPPQDFVVGRYNDTAGTLSLLESQRDPIAAILVEPMLGAGGCIPGEPDFLRALREAATATGALLVFDEIQTSRLSVAGRQGLLGIVPDLTTLGKFYGGGLAFGCFGGRRDVMDLFDPRRPQALSHPGTFNNNTLTMAAGYTAVSTLLTESSLQRLNEAGDALRGALMALIERAQAPFAVTGLGSLLNVHATGEEASAVALRRLLYRDLLAAGIFIAERGLIALSLAITAHDIRRLCEAFGEFLNRRRNCF